jgi:hypothetical protein
MVIKGGSRAGPKQLATHLLRTDTNERVQILDLHSPIEDLHETFRDWQVLASGTRGSLGLYHANIDPAQDYQMTEEQWLRSVDVLEKELGLDGQPRAVVLHEKHGRQHIHVVWQRTDIEQMKLVSDSYNYLAHEKASYQLEEEFGHEHVPGKHAKRDRDKQPEFPKADINHAEWQQMERTGIDPRARKEQITELYERSDTGQAFKAALEEQGYILARGKNRNYVLVDEQAEIYSLTRHITSENAGPIKKFMAHYPPASLPDYTEAQATQLQRATDRALEAAANAKESQTQEAKASEPQQPEQQPKPEPKPDTAEDRRFREALEARQAKDTQKLLDDQKQEAEAERTRLDADIRAKMDNLAKRQDAERRRLQDKQEAEESILTRIDRKLRPERAAQRDRTYQKARDDLAQKHREQRQGQITRFRQARDAELDRLIQRQMKDLADQKARHAQESERYRAERQQAERIGRELAQERQRLEELKRSRDGPEQGPTR